MKLHEQREIEDAMQSDESAEEDTLPRKRRRGGEVGRDWICAEPGCSKDFKSVCLSRLNPFVVLRLISAATSRRKKH